MQALKRIAAGWSPGIPRNLGRTFFWLSLWAGLPLWALPGVDDRPGHDALTSQWERAWIEFQIVPPNHQAPGTLRLVGADARQQLLVAATLSHGAGRDFTRHVAYDSSPAGVVEVSATGLVTPLRDGQAVITATTTHGNKAQLKVLIENYDLPISLNFANQIVPLFSKYGCNAGGCHGNSGGQNGFRLSLLGFEPADDYDYLVKEARGRRIFPAAPENSLLLLKASGGLPHGGGARIQADSDDYRLLVRWISQGMPAGSPDDRQLSRIEVFPKQKTMRMGEDQQLVVLASYSDGSYEDVTRSALFEANEKEMATTTSDGLVRLFEQPGDVAVMVRYQGEVGVFRATVPLGAPVGNLPAPRNAIDELVFTKLREVGMPPSGPSGDTAFLRRTALDIAGRLPTAEETERFLGRSDAGKRDEWVDELLASGSYADFFANKWSALLRNKRGAGTHTRGTYAFHAWIRDSLFENKPFDQFARSIIAASGDIEDNPPVAWYRQVRNSTAQVEDAAQLFLGTRLQCAQCHHHPYERWSQQDYFGFAAFFSQVSRKPGARPGEEIIFHQRGEAKAVHQKTKRPVSPSGLGAAPVMLSLEEDPRHALMDWMAAPENPFFARALVNRYWKHFLGRALVEPEDDLRATNPAKHPELLDALAQDFITSGYNLKHLVRTICTSRVYQFDSHPNEYNGNDKHYYSRYYPKRLSAEVLLDAIDQVTQAESRFEGLPSGTRAVQLPDNSFNADSYFLTVFGRPDSASACECERSQDASLAQSLHLLNSKDVQEKIIRDQGRAATLAQDMASSDQTKIRDLYLSFFSREPVEEEMDFARRHLEKKAGQAQGSEEVMARRKEAFEDILWALINTKEFLFNH